MYPADILVYPADSPLPTPNHIQMVRPQVTLTRQPWFLGYWLLARRSAERGGG